MTRMQLKRPDIARRAEVVNKTVSEWLRGRGPLHPNAMREKIEGELFTPLAVVDEAARERATRGEDLLRPGDHADLKDVLDEEDFLLAVHCLKAIWNDRAFDIGRWAAIMGNLAYFTEHLDPRLSARAREAAKRDEPRAAPRGQDGALS